MHPLTSADLHASFVNCSRGEARRAEVPDLTAVAWEHLDFLGWQDPSGSPKAWLVVPGADGPLGLVLRRPAASGGGRSAMCDVCATPHSSGSVALTVAAKTGAAGKKGDSTGSYLCRDLACSLYVRGRKVPTAARLRETLSQEAMVERLRRNLDTYVQRVLGDPAWHGRYADHVDQPA